MGRGNNGQPTFSGARIGDARGTRAWLDHQAMQGPGGQWNPQQPSVQPSQWALPPNQPGGPGGWPMQQPVSFLFTSVSSRLRLRMVFQTLVLQKEEEASVMYVVTGSNLLKKICFKKRNCIHKSICFESLSNRFVINIS